MVANPGAIATRCETSFPAGAPQRCRGKSTGLTLNVVAPDGRLTDGLKVGAGARKVSLLLGLAQVEFRPSWAPPISMPILLPSTARLPSVLRRIALSSKTSDSGNGVLSNRNTGQTTTALKLPQPPMGRKGLKLSFPARTGRNLANTQSIDTI